MWKQILPLIVSLLFFCSVSAKEGAGLKVEPYAGYFKGSSKGSGNSAIASADFESWFAGARIGVESEKGYMIGIDYGQGQGTIGLPLTGDADYNSSDFGAFIGMGLGEYLTIHGSYIFMHAVDVEDGAISQKWEGDGYNVGVGIKGIPQVRINVEYQIRNIKEVDSQSIGSGNQTKAFMLRLSLPINFPLEMFMGK